MPTTQLHDIWFYGKYLLKSMYEYFNSKILGSFGLSIFGFLFGLELNHVLEALLALVVIDFVTGVMAAWKSGQPIKSRMALRSAIKLTVYSLMVSGAHLTEVAVPGTTLLDEGMVAFLALTELISVIENAGNMGFAIPQKLLNMIIQLRGDNEEETEIVKNLRVGPPTRRADEIVIPKP